MLVDIPTNSTLDGMSPPGELNVRQRIDNRCLGNLQRFADAFFARFAIRLVITEGARSRPRQSWLWANRFRLGVAVARPFTSRHDEVNSPNAVDLGSNIAKARSAQAQWAHEHCETYGLVWTGAGFNESWHFEIMYGAIVPANVGTAVIHQNKEPEDFTMHRVRDGAAIYLVTGNGVTHLSPEENAALSHLPLVEKGTLPPIQAIERAIKRTRQ